MSDEKLRALQRKASADGEWMPYLVEAQRAGVLLEDALRESAGALIPCTRDNQEILHTFAQMFDAQAMLWIHQAADRTQDIAVLAATYAALGREDNANETLELVPEEQMPQVRARMAIEAEQNNHHEYAENLTDQNPDIIAQRAEAAAENRNYARATELILRCPPSPSLFLPLAQAAAENKNHEQAESFADNVQPAEQAYVELTKIAAFNGDLENAVRFSEKTNERIREARVFLAAVHALHGDYATASQHARDSSDANHAHWVMAEACAERRDYKKAGRLARKVSLEQTRIVACASIIVAAAHNKDYPICHQFMPNIRDDPDFMEQTRGSISTAAAQNKDYDQLPFFLPGPGYHQTLALGCVANAQLRNGDLQLALQTVNSMEDPESMAVGYCDLARILRGAR